MPMVHVSLNTYVNSKVTKSHTRINKDIDNGREILGKDLCLPALLRYITCLLVVVCVMFQCDIVHASHGFVELSQKELSAITDEYDEDFKIIKETSNNKEPKAYSLFYDVDSDGKDELLITIGHSSFCGTGGCTVDIYKKTQDGWVLMDLGFPSLHVVPKKTGTDTKGMPDYVFEDNLWKYDGNRYRWNRKIQYGEFGIDAPSKNDLLPQLK